MRSKMERTEALFFFFYIYIFVPALDLGPYAACARACEGGGSAWKQRTHSQAHKHMRGAAAVRHKFFLCVHPAVRGGVRVHTGQRASIRHAYARSGLVWCVRSTLHVCCPFMHTHSAAPLHAGRQTDRQRGFAVAARGGNRVGQRTLIMHNAFIDPAEASLPSTSPHNHQHQHCARCRSVWKRGGGGERRQEAGVQGSLPSCKPSTRWSDVGCYTVTKVAA